MSIQPTRYSALQQDEQLYGVHPTTLANLKFDMDFQEKVMTRFFLGSRLAATEEEAKEAFEKIAARSDVDAKVKEIAKRALQAPLPKERVLGNPVIGNTSVPETSAMLFALYHLFQENKKLYLLHPARKKEIPLKVKFDDVNISDAMVEGLIAVRCYGEYWSNVRSLTASIETLRGDASQKARELLPTYQKELSLYRNLMIQHEDLLSKKVTDFPRGNFQFLPDENLTHILTIAFQIIESENGWSRLNNPPTRLHFGAKFIQATGADPKGIQLIFLWMDRIKTDGWEKTVKDRLDKNHNLAGVFQRI